VVRQRYAACRNEVGVPESVAEGLRDTPVEPLGAPDCAEARKRGRENMKMSGVKAKIQREKQGDLRPRYVVSRGRGGVPLYFIRDRVSNQRVKGTPLFNTKAEAWKYLDTTEAHWRSTNQKNSFGAPEGGRMIRFNALLRDEGVDPADVKLVRHQDTRHSARITPFKLWRADAGQFELYQKIQKRTVFQKARY
jgi:hypothetical protein